MARDAALITRFTRPFPGRETKALEVFEDFITFWSKKAADGYCTAPETFFCADGSDAMSIVRGKSDALRDIYESEEHEQLFNKAQLTVDDVRAQLWYGGSEEETERLMRTFALAGHELGYL